VTWAFVALLFILDAPSSLSADAERVRRVDTTRLGDALQRAGLPVPGDVTVTLVPDSDPRARGVPDQVVGLAFGERDIVIFPERVLSYPYDSLESVVRHEVTHLALNVGAGGHAVPRWFHEGVAVSVDSGWNTTAQLRLLVAMLARPDIAQLTRLFTSRSASETTQAYLLSAALVDDIRQRHGADVPGRIVGRMAGGIAFARAFQDVTGGTPDAAAALAWAGYRRWTAWVPAVTSASAAWTLILLLAVLAFAVQRRRRARRRRQWDEEERPTPIAAPPVDRS
jgi:hypothetical protein